MPVSITTPDGRQRLVFSATGAVRQSLTTDEINDGTLLALWHADRRLAEALAADWAQHRERPRSP